MKAVIFALALAILVSIPVAYLVRGIQQYNATRDTQLSFSVINIEGGDPRMKDTIIKTLHHQGLRDGVSGRPTLLLHVYVGPYGQTSETVVTIETSTSDGRHVVTVAHAENINDAASDASFRLVGMFGDLHPVHQ